MHSIKFFIFILFLTSGVWASNGDFLIQVKYFGGQLKERTVELQFKNGICLLKKENKENKLAASKCTSFLKSYESLLTSAPPIPDFMDMERPTAEVTFRAFETNSKSEKKKWWSRTIIRHHKICDEKNICEDPSQAPLMKLVNEFLTLEKK